MSDTLHLAYFTHTLDDRAVAQHVTPICDVFRQRGHRASLVCAIRKPTGHVPDGVELVDLGLGRRRTAFGIVKLARWMRSSDVDVVFAAGNGPGRAALIARMLARRHVCVVPVEQTHYSSTAGGRAWRDRITRFLYGRADLVGGVSEAVVADLEANFPSIAGRTVVLLPPGPSRDQTIRSAAQRPEHEWFADPNIVTLTSVGNLIPRKGQDVLIEALGELGADSPHIRLVLVGRPDDETYVARLHERARELGVTERVWFAGFQANPLPFIRHCNVFVHAARSEGLGNVLVEAMACEVPVVATACPAVPEVLLHGKAGLLVPVDDAHALADGIRKVLSDETYRTELIRTGSARAADFDLETIAQEHLDAAHRCMEAAPGQS